MARRIMLAVLFSLTSTTGQAATWFDRSHSAFFPPEFSRKLSVQQSFPAFWWNFLVFDKNPTEACTALTKEAPKGLIRRMACGDESAFLTQLKPVISDWAADSSLRIALPQDREIQFINDKLNAALTKASLPLGQALLWVLRVDPLETYHVLLDRAKSRIALNLQHSSTGIFSDPVSKRSVVAVQFSFPPTDTIKTGQIQEHLSNNNIVMVGAHAATLENELQVSRDLAMVSRVGLILLIVIAIALAISRRWRLLFLAPPILASTTLGALGTILVFGKIHGLTLSFGTGIIGLSLDYGLHRAFNPNDKGVWRANAFGLLTTLCGLIVMGFSSIPLLRQLMVFSSLGLIAGFATYWILDRLFSKWIIHKPLAIKHSVSTVHSIFVGLLVLCSIAGVGGLRPNLDMAQFNFESPSSAGINAWLYSKVTGSLPLVEMDEGSPALILEKNHIKSRWAADHGIRIENVAQYVPPSDLSKENAATWSSTCKGQMSSFSKDKQRFFEPFLASLPCEDLKPRTSVAALEQPRHYLQDLHSPPNRWLTLWLPQSENEAASIRSYNPSAVSLREIVSTFPETLSRELRWMVPLALALSILLLWLYYLSMKLTFLSLLPFLSGLGLFFLAVKGLHLQYSFVSIIALVMVFGFSIDYGIFATDFVRSPKEHSDHGVWTSLFFAMLTTLTGFLPLLFCKHPVLLHLGQALVLGTIGTYMGAIWGIPGFHRILGAK